MKGHEREPRWRPSSGAAAAARGSEPPVEPGCRSAPVPEGVSAAGPQNFAVFGEASVGSETELKSDCRSERRRAGLLQPSSVRLCRTAQFWVNRSPMCHYHQQQQQQPTQPVSKDKSSVAEEVLSAVSRRADSTARHAAPGARIPAVTRSDTRPNRAEPNRAEQLSFHFVASWFAPRWNLPASRSRS